MIRIALIVSACCLLASGCDDGCDYNGKHYSRGSSFMDRDLCNSCFCGDDGEVGCTAMACAPVVPQNGSWCVPTWGNAPVTPSNCHVTELQPDGTLIAQLPECGVDGGTIGDAGSSACWELPDDSSCSGTGKRLSITPPSETSGHLFRVDCDPQLHASGLGAASRRGPAARASRPTCRAPRAFAS